MTDADRSPRFDPIAKAYLAHAKTSAYNAMYDRPAVLELLGDVAGSRVLVRTGSLCA
jgi:hypothetical protein